jgi:hypothetical protein
MKILQSFLLGSLLAQFTAAVNDNLPQCNGQDKDEYAFYTADIVLASVDPAYQCSELQLTTLGFLIQDIVDEVEGIMPEYKNEYIRTILCPLPKAEDDKGRRKLLLDSKVQNENIFDSSQRDLTVQRKRYTFKARGTCRRCKNRTTSRQLAVSFTAMDVCTETKEALHIKMHTERSCDAAVDMLVTVTELAWIYDNESARFIEIGDETIAECHRATRSASTAAREAVTLCEKALSESSAFNMRHVMKKVQQAKKATKDSASLATEALRQIENAKNQLEDSKIHVGSFTPSNRKLGSSHEWDDTTVNDVCNQVNVAKAGHTSAENMLETAKRIIEEMKAMSKDSMHYKDVQKILKEAQKCCDDIEKEKENVFKEVEKVQEQCDKAREKPKDAPKMMKEAVKKTEEATKKLLKAHAEMLELKAEQERLEELARIIGFEPVLSKLTETVKQDTDKAKEKITEIEDEITKIDAEIKEIPELTEAERLKQLEEEKNALQAENDELKRIALANEEFLSRQALVEEDLYRATLTRPSENNTPLLQVLFASCNGQTKGAINLNPYTQTRTLAEWLTKFGALLIDEIPRRLPRVYNSTNNGCIDGPNFCVIVNITEVKQPFDDMLDEECVKNAATLFDV